MPDAAPQSSSSRWTKILTIVGHVSAILGLAPIVAILLSLRSLVRRSRIQLFVAPDLAVLYALLVAGTVASFLLLLRSQRKLREGESRYRAQALIWPLTFCFLSAGVYFLPTAYQSGLHAWEATSKALLLNLEADGSAFAQYTQRATARRENLRYFVMSIPVMEGLTEHDLHSDQGDVEILGIAGKNYVGVKLNAEPRKGDNVAVGVSTRYSKLFAETEEFVSLVIDQLYEEVSIDVTFPKDRPVREANLWLFYLQSYEAISGEMMSQDRLHFGFRSRDRLGSWLPYGGTYRLHWKW